MRQIAIVGLGLIGGSLGMRIRERGLAEVLGIDVDAAVIEKALRVGAADDATTDLERVGEADIVILAVPLEQVVSVGREAARHTRDGTVVTDVGSVKEPVVKALGHLRGVRFVGGHPMFGTERQGIEHAAATLMDDHPYLVTPVASTGLDALAEVEDLARGMGMRPLRLSPEVHDRLVAQVSHLPYLVALALASSVDPGAEEVAGPGFKDATRIARSPVALWDEIVRQNRSHILMALDRLDRRLRDVREAIERQDLRSVVDEMGSGGDASPGELVEEEL